jgi:hypothetical protein
MDGLELHMRKCGLKESRGSLWLVMHEFLQRGHALMHPVRRRGDKRRHSRAHAADPVLGGPKLAGLLFTASSTSEQRSVYLAEQPIGDRNAFAHSLHAEFERSYVVRDLAHVVERNPGCFLDLEEEQIRERGLRAFDLRGEDCFLADEGIEEECGVGQETRHAIEASEREQRPIHFLAKCRVNFESRRGREGLWDERSYGLSAYGGPRLDRAGGTPLHTLSPPLKVPSLGCPLFKVVPGTFTNDRTEAGPASASEFWGTTFRGPELPDANVAANGRARRHNYL